MMSNSVEKKSDTLVGDYLEELQKALAGLGSRERKELLDDLREHIANERAGLPAESEAGVRQILDRLGSPQTVAAAARAESQGMPPRTRRFPRPLLIALALLLGVVILGLLGFLFFFAEHSEETGVSSPHPVSSSETDPPMP